MTGRGNPSGEGSPVDIGDLDREGRGVGRVHGKAVFVEGALPGEEVRLRYLRRRPRFDEAVVLDVLRCSSERVQPHCPHFEVCGGCRLQHLRHDAQVRAKQVQLAGILRAHAGVEAERWLDPLSGRPWGYRRSARLGARYVAGQGGALVGFRELRSSRIAVLKRCDVLHPAVGRRVQALRELLTGLEARRRIPQIAVAAGDDEVALVFRHLVPLSAADKRALESFGRAHGLRVYLQSGGPHTVAALWPEAPGPLRYALPQFGLELSFEPTDFIQVNAEVNRALVARAVELLEPVPGERVLDLFCGIGNFTLPLARQGGSVMGLDGDRELIERARANARRNSIANAEFHLADLAAPTTGEQVAARSCAKLLLDPPRAGAAAIVEGLTPPYPARIVYISCNPATLARDAGILVHRHGYRLGAASAVDMFPHTAHIEAIAVFERPC